MTRMELLLAFAVIYRLRTLDVQIHHHGFLPASDHNRFTRHIQAGVNFLMRDVGRNVNEVSRVCLIAEFQAITPSHAGTTSHDVDHRLQFAMMVGTSLGVGLYDDGTRPQLAGSGTSVSDGGGPSHSWSLGRVRIQVSRVHDLYAMFLPVQCSILQGPATIKTRHYDGSIPIERLRCKGRVKYGGL